MGEPLHQPKACRSCGAAIFWAKNDATGRSMPVDAEPSEKGNVQLVDRGGSVIAKVLGPEEARQVRDSNWALRGVHVLRMPHFATCAQASSWRTKKPREARDG
jgi:hypothetical protein